MIKLFVKEEDKKTDKRCHWGSKFVFQWQNLRFFGAGSFRGMNLEGIDALIDCGANIRRDAAAIDEKGHSRQIEGDRMIKINWADGNAPDMTEKDWRNILNDLEQLRRRAGKDNLNILVCCLGGHGRTGTALAVLAAITGIAPQNPVTFVRKKYCEKAVETMSQCTYIRGIALLGTETVSPAFESESGPPCESGVV